jgi:hypothetical protein
MRNHRFFPTFAVVLLVIGVLWLLSELGVMTIQIPWVPVVLIVVAIGMIINRCCRTKA